MLEYLCARYIDPNDPLPGQKKIDRILQEHYVESGAKELIKHRIVERGEYTLLGPLSLVYDQRRLHYWADVPALGDSNVRVSDRVLKCFRRYSPDLWGLGDDENRVRSGVHDWEARLPV